MFVAIHDKSLIPSLQVISRKDLTKGGKTMIPAKFYVHNYYDDCLEEHDATPGYDFTRWSQWLDEGRVYVDRPKQSINVDLLI